VSGVDYAPHRPSDRGRLARAVSRVWERIVVVVFRVVSFLLVRVPLRVSEPIARVGFIAGYYLWPSKRRIIKHNAAHVLGLPVSHRDVAGLARGVYGTYSRFAVEVMRLPNLPADEPERLMIREGEHHDRFLAHCRRCAEEGRGVIAVSGHIGSIEVFAGAYANEGLPMYGLADDSAFPELFERLNASRARWGVTIIPWKKLRDIFRVMRTPAILGMVVDWGYRSDDLPVKLFGSWTTLPAGPATLAARTGATIVPVVARRTADGRYTPVMHDPIEVTDASPAAIAAATQGIADALEDMVAVAPDQWYTFKPMWPVTEAEIAELERRAAEAEVARG
jgi:KDO2-lipid IV(A) lauroyltransferase